MLGCALKCMPAADEEGPEAERLRLYDVQWLDEPSLAQARIGEEALNPTYLQDPHARVRTQVHACCR